MSDNTQDNSRTQAHLQAEIASLKEQQVAAQNLAAIVGMTPEDSRDYKERHFRIKELREQLSALESQQNPT